MSRRIAFIVCLIMVVTGLAMAGRAAPVQSGTVTVPTDPEAVGYLNLSKRHPDALAGPAEFATAYATTPAVERLDQIKDFLKSFRQLTDRTRGRLSAADLRTIGNTGREMQSIGFHNIPLVVEGTVLKLDYQLKQVEYALAQLRLAQGEVTPQDVERAKTAYSGATKRLQLFWDTKRPVD